MTYLPSVLILLMTSPLDSPLKANSFSMKRRSSLSSQNPPSVLALRNSISKGVKYGDVSLINRKPSQRGEDEVIPDIAGEKTEGAFDSVRKKYDKLKKQRIMREKSVEKLKEQLQKSKQEEVEYMGKKNQAMEVSGNLERKMTEVKQEFEMNGMQQASFSHIRERLKLGNQFERNRALGLEIQKRELKRLLFDSNNMDLNLDAEATKTKTLLEVLRYEFQKESQERQSHLETLRNKIQEIKQTNAEFQQRENEIRQIAEKAIQDKDQNQKWWRRALLTNKLVNKFLQNKMHIEMEKFNVVETAFKNIKIATGVLDGPTMVTRYIEKEKIYGRLLDSIAKSEKEIDKLNEVRDGLLREKKELEAEIAQSDANLNKGSQSLNEQYHKLNSISQKNDKSDVCTYKVSEWLSRQFKKISNNTLNQTPSSTTPSPSSSIKQDMVRLLLWLKEECDRNIENGIDVDKFVQVDEKRISQKEQDVGGSDSDINQNQLEEEEDFVESERKQFIKENRKSYEKMKKDRKEKEFLLFEQESKMKFTKLEKVEGEKIKEVEKQKEKVEAE